ncbi:hypothetical protein IJ843_00585 [bacterium]|nr:hypothetical protein [bacterium]
MGMSASQARLLSITSRISDIEFKSQQISNVKIRLADESEKVANAYTQALNKQKLVYTTFNNGSVQNVNLTVNELMKSNSPYRLKAANGKMIVASDIKNNYLRVMKDWNTHLNGWNSTNIQQKGETQENFLNRMKSSGYWKSSESQEDFLARVQREKNWKQGVMNNPESRKNNCKASFVLQQIWGQAGYSACYESLGLDPYKTEGGYETLVAHSDHTMDEVHYYEDLFEQLYTATTANSVWVDRQEYNDGTTREAHEDKLLDPDALLILDDSINNDPNWLYEAIESGEFMLISVATNEEVSVSGEVSLQMVSDSTGMAKAEAEYNAATAKINSKEKKLDNELKKLDTEHNALNTEFDSVKSLIGDNVEKSFNLFS